ncbi:MAG: hypothetical protein U0793_12055 [Gemmataceae bacterium]
MDKEPALTWVAHELPGPSWQGPVWRYAAADAEKFPFAMVDLQETRRQRMRQLLDLVLVTLVALLIISLLPRSRALARATWPEQLIAAAFLGAFAWDWSALAFALIGVGILGRAWIQVLRLRGWVAGLWRTAPPPPEAASGA